MLFALIGVIIGKLRYNNENIFVEDTISYPLNGIVDRTGHYHDEVFGYFLGVSSDSLYMYKIDESLQSYSKKRGAIGSFIKIGDSICKKSNDKVVAVYRNKKKICTFYLE
ncbi:hypothetical protein [Flavobacterium rhizosphaerae]|uniref:Uncharacterized protein n=1 Tax=Flavobacterium rhizosphaerae TaxID=3163298 RepID=A0ABW8Z0E9_9FLAO